MYQIARKTHLCKNLRRLQKLFPNDYNFFPELVYAFRLNRIKSTVQIKTVSDDS